MMKKKEPVTEAFDAFKRIDELEKENQNLAKQIKKLKFDSLSYDERAGAERAFNLLRESYGEFIDDLECFRLSYIDYKDNELPFND